LLFDDCESGRDVVDVHVCVEGRQEQVGGEADGVWRGVQFVEEALVPGVGAVVEEELGCGEKTSETLAMGWEGEGEEFF
jgi:hypothetical protein